MILTGAAATLRAVSTSALLLLALLANATSALAAEVTGKWKGPMEGTGAGVVLDSEGKPQPITKGSLD
jgi:hypothetical protein